MHINLVREAHGVGIGEGNSRKDDCLGVLNDGASFIGGQRAQVETGELLVVLVNESLRAHQGAAGKVCGINQSLQVISCLKTRSHIIHEHRGFLAAQELGSSLLEGGFCGVS